MKLTIEFDNDPDEGAEIRKLRFSTTHMPPGVNIDLGEKALWLDGDDLVELRNWLTLVLGEA